MTEPATEKQLSFARSLGIQNPENFSKMALKELIDTKLREKNGGVAPQKPAYKPFTASPQPVQASRHDVIVEQKLKPHSYEFGKATNRFKVYYENVEDLKEHIKALEEAGFITDPVGVEVEKIGE